MIEPDSLQPSDLFEMSERQEAATVVVSLSGELDYGTAAAVQQRLAELRDAQQPVLLDLDGLTFMDSTGIRLVLTACEDATKREWSFRVTRGSERVQHVLEAARVIDRLPYDDRPER